MLDSLSCTAPLTQNTTDQAIAAASPTGLGSANWPEVLVSV